MKYQNIKKLRLNIINSPIKFSHNASKMFVYLQFYTLKIEKNKSQGHYSGTTHVKIKIVKSLN